MGKFILGVLVACFVFMGAYTILPSLAHMFDFNLGILRWILALAIGFAVGMKVGG